MVDRGCPLPQSVGGVRIVTDARGSEAFDVVVVGSGAGALTAALTAAEAGLSVVVLEKERHFGGASARSGGGLWIPGNRLAVAAGHPDSREEALTYLRHEAGALFDEDRAGAFLDHAPAMFDLVCEQTSLSFVLLTNSDYHPHHPGGKAVGRSVMPRSIDGRALGADLARLRPPLAASTFAGMQIGIEDFYAFNTATRRAKSALRVAKRLARRAADGVRYGRSVRLASGNALVGGLAIRCRELGVRIETGAPVRELVCEGDRMTGVLADLTGSLTALTARCAVILATGGFPHDGARRARLFPAGARADEACSLMPHGNTGDGLHMGEKAGGRAEGRMKSAVALSPISRIDTSEGTLAGFPIFAHRGDPGKIAVRRDGRRFTDEAASYHDFCAGLLQAAGCEADASAWIVSDHRSLRRYGLGIAHPGLPIVPHVRSGYLLRGRTLRELAQAAGIDRAALEETVARFNRHAREGSDPDFGRGSNVYDLWAGDPAHRPCPCLGPLETGPFYALRVFAGCVGTFAGLVTDAAARVLDERDAPIAGLYAVGNDCASITGGDYIAGGCTLGPAMTFGYIAARHIAAGAG